MVCVPCVAIPVFLIIFRFLIMPIINFLWRFQTGEKIKDQKPELVKECKNGVCTLSWKKKDEKSETEDKIEAKAEKAD